MCTPENLMNSLALDIFNTKNSKITYDNQDNGDDATELELEGAVAEVEDGAYNVNTSEISSFRKMKLIDAHLTAQVFLNFLYNHMKAKVPANRFMVDLEEPDSSDPEGSTLPTPVYNDEVIHLDLIFPDNSTT